MVRYFFYLELARFETRKRKIVWKAKRYQASILGEGDAPPRCNLASVGCGCGCGLRIAPHIAHTSPHLTSPCLASPRLALCHIPSYPSTLGWMPGLAWLFHAAAGTSSHALVFPSSTPELGGRERVGQHGDYVAGVQQQMPRNVVG